MMNIRRRDIIKALSVTALIAALPGCGENDPIKTTLKKSFELPKSSFDGVMVLEDYLSVKDKLQEKVKQTLASTEQQEAYQKLIKMNETEVYTAIENDFATGNTVQFNEYVFSRTEVALYAFHLKAVKS